MTYSRHRFRQPVLKRRRWIVAQGQRGLSLALKQQVEPRRSGFDRAAEHRVEFVVAVHRESLAHYFGRLIVAVKRHQRLGQLESERREPRLSLRTDQRRQRIPEFSFKHVGFSFSDKCPRVTRLDARCLFNQRPGKRCFLPRHVEETELSQEAIIRRRKLHSPLYLGGGFFITPQGKQPNRQTSVRLGIVGLERNLFAI